MNIIKSTMKLLAIPAMFLISGHAQAGLCWSGYIDSVSEGSFNQDNTFLMMSDVNGVRIKGGFLNGDMMRIKETASDDRKKGLRALAYLALTNGLFVEVWATGGCAISIDEIKVFRSSLSS